MKRYRFESFMKFIIQSPKYGTFTEAARTDPEQYSHDTWRAEFVVFHSLPINKEENTGAQTTPT